MCAHSVNMFLRLLMSILYGQFTENCSYPALAPITCAYHLTMGEICSGRESQTAVDDDLLNYFSIYFFISIAEITVMQIQIVYGWPFIGR